MMTVASEVHWAAFTMRHAMHRVSRFSILGPYALAVLLADGTEQRINFEPVLHGTLFGPLRDVATFNRVALDTNRKR